MEERLKQLADIYSRCKKCGGSLEYGKAMQSTFAGIPDFPGDDHAITLSAGGTGKLIAVLKCKDCGWSIR